MSMSNKNQMTARTTIFLLWLIVLTPIYTANALELQFNVHDINAGTTSAVVKWKTDINSTGLVRYGEDAMNKEVTSPELKTDHEVTLTDLTPSTKYKFQIVATAGQESKKAPAEAGQGIPFTTGSAGDTTPPSAVTALQVTETKADSVSLSWDIDAALTPDLDSFNIYRNAEKIANVKTKTYTDTKNLTAGNEYQYQVSAVDTAGNEGAKSDVSATPGGAAQHIGIENLKFEVIGTNVLFTWDTTIPSHSRVRYGVNPLLLDQKKEDGVYTTKHNLTLTALQKDTTYTFIAESCDAQSNCGNSSVQTFKTSVKAELFLDVEHMDCNPSTVQFHNSNLMDVSGYSAPGADILIYMNDERQRYLRVASNGRFQFGGIRLNPKLEENKIRIVADDRLGKTIECIEDIRLDYLSPEVEFDNSTKNLSVSTTQNVQIKGTVIDDNPVTMYVYVQSVDDTVPPSKVLNLVNSSVDKNSVTISWDKLLPPNESTGVAPGSVTDVNTLNIIGGDLPSVGGSISGFASLDEGEGHTADQITGYQTASASDPKDDTLMYIIYRSDVSDGPIATVDHPTTQFVDQNVSSKTTYTYQVSAMDKAGNEGAKSDPITVTTLANGTTVAPRQSIVPASPSLKTTKELKTAPNTTISFSDSVGPLFEGRNKIRVVFEDVAGNKFEKTFDVVLDSEPPKVLSPSSADLSTWYNPSYVSEINIKGQANKENGEIWVYVNVDPNSKDAKPTQKAPLGPNGTYSVDVVLATSISAAVKSSFDNKSQTAGVGVVGREGTPNQINLVAVDAYGRHSAPVSGSVIYKPCGDGNQWVVKIKEGGNIINTRELMEGVAAYGFGYELEWQGGGPPANVTVSSVRVVPATIGAKEREKYDFDWINTPTTTAPRGNRTKGFVLLGFKPQIVEGKTYYDREKNLSDHRKGECWPWAGCIRLLLEMNINFNSPYLQQQYAAQMQGQAGSTSTAAQIKAPTNQKTCLEVKIQLDERVNPALIPKGLLRGAIEAINATLQVVDAIEKPLEYVAKITLGFCLLSFFSKLVMKGLRTYYCKYTSALSQLTKGGGGIAGIIKSGKMETIAAWDNGDDEKGSCAVEFGGEKGSDEAKTACKTCAQWITKEKWITDKWHLFCDRISCPPVPTLQHFIIEKYGKVGKPSPWRFVEAATARAANQCLKNAPLMKECLCGLKPTAPTCKSGQMCDGESCKDIKKCVQGQMATETCYCTTTAGAPGTPPYCKTGQQCADGHCHGTSTTSLSSSTAPTRTGEELCKQYNPQWGCAITMADWKKQHPGKTCLPNENCTTNRCSGQFAKYYCVYSPGAQALRLGEEKCKAKNPTWSCDCSTKLWSSTKCDEDPNCERHLCSGSRDSYYCCSSQASKVTTTAHNSDEAACKDFNKDWSCACSTSVWTSAKCVVENGCVTDKCSGALSAKRCCSPEALKTGADPKWNSQWKGFVYTDPSTKKDRVQMDCRDAANCVWRYRDKSGYPLASNVIFESNMGYYATQTNGQVWECKCPNWDEAKKVKDGNSNNRCAKRTECTDPKECTMCPRTSIPTGSSITALEGETVAAIPEEQDSSSSFGLITGMDVLKPNGEIVFDPVDVKTGKTVTTSGTAAGTTSGTTAGTTSGTTNGRTSNSRTAADIKAGVPIYDRVIGYEKKGQYHDSNFVRAQSDCQFARLGRDDIQKMWDFYKNGNEDEKKKCEKGHVYQAACCPYEYMDSWGWGMMFQNEMKLSYCLAHPENKDVCGTGAQITTGVTGICTPKGSAKRHQPVALKGVEYAKDYPVKSLDKFNDQVVYLVDIDEKGSAKSVKRGYYTRAEVKSTVGNIESDGRVAIATGTYFKPLDNAQELNYAFPKRDNADPQLDEEGFKEGVEAFAKDLCVDVDAKRIVPIRKASKVTLIQDCATFKKNPSKVPKGIENQYRLIMNLLGEPHRQYLAQPASSFIDSLFTLCLSALLSWMQHFKNFAKLLMTCLQTILITGDGSAGQCRSIMSQYFCDILQQLISCISRRFGGGSGSRIGTTGFGGVFSSIHEASNSVIAEANSRYGKNNLFSTTFNAENLAYDACIFMFTGEWPTDWKSVFESAVKMPINTTALVFPVTRRWQAYDGNTGYARYVYRVAYSISAGANIQYKLYLRASGTEKTACPNGEKCDGSYETIQGYQQRGRTIKLQIPGHQSGDCPDNGMLQQGKLCDDEVLYVVSGPQAALRFDQAVVEWTPTETPTTGPSGKAQFQGSMVSAASVSGAAAGDIREIGAAPEGLCEFSVADLAFRCGVTVPVKGRAQIVKAESARADNEPFEVGEDVILNIQVANELPKDATTCADQCEFTKYLVIDKILNQNNIEIYPPAGTFKVGEKINSPGIHNYQFFTASQFPQTAQAAGKPFKIKEEDFSATKTVGSRCALQKEGLLSGAISGKDCTGARQVFIRIECKDDGTECNYAEGSRVKGVFQATGALTPCETKPTVNKAGLYKFKCDGITITADGRALTTLTKKKSTQKGAKNQGLSFMIDNQPPATTIATSFQCSSTPVQWTAYVQLRETVESGGGFKMSTGPLVDPESNKKQEVPVKFKVVCKGTGRAGSSQNTLAGLASFTAKVSKANTINNKTYGVWVDEDSLGPGESVTVGGFRWVNARNPTEGFSINIDSRASGVVLHLDVGSIGLIPTPNIYFAKNNQALQECAKSNNKPPCLYTIGDVNDRQIAILLDKGDPPFQFAGFKQAAGLASVSEIVLTQASPANTDAQVALAGLTEATKNMKVTINDYAETSDGFSFRMTSDPTDVFDPFGLVFSTSAAGFRFKSDVSMTVDGQQIPVCGGQSPTGASVISGPSTPIIYDSTVDAGDDGAFASITGFQTKTPTAKPSAAMDKIAGTMPSDSKHCWFGMKTTAGEGIAFKTLGSGSPSGILVSVSGLEKLETSTLSSFSDAVGQKIILTKDRNSIFGFTGIGWSAEADHKIIIDIQKKDKTSMELLVENTESGTEAGGKMQLQIELAPAGLGTTANTQVQEAGAAGVLPDCSPSIVTNCVKGRDADRLILMITKMSPGKKLRISGLKENAKGSAREKCAKLENGAACGQNSLCYVPPIEGTAKECMSQCRINFINNKLQTGIWNTGSLQEYSKTPGESAFCGKGTRYRCKSGAIMQSGSTLCPNPGEQCCPDGSGYTKPIYYGSPAKKVETTVNYNGVKYTRVGDVWYKDCTCTKNQETANCLLNCGGSFYQWKGTIDDTCAKCGDGSIEILKGEECDPKVSDFWLNCQGTTHTHNTCDPKTCKCMDVFGTVPTPGDCSTTECPQGPGSICMFRSVQNKLIFLPGVCSQDCKCEKM